MYSFATQETILLPSQAPLAGSSTELFHSKQGDMESLASDK